MFSEAQGYAGAAAEGDVECDLTRHSGGNDSHSHIIPHYPDEPPNLFAQSEWGLSLHLTSQKGTETKRSLLDFAYSDGVLNNNIDLLGIDLPAVDSRTP